MSCIITSVPLANIDFSLLAHSSSKTTTNTLDRCQSIDNLLLSIDVSVEHTENVLELSLVNKSLPKWLDMIVGENRRTIMKGVSSYGRKQSKT